MVTRDFDRWATRQLDGSTVVSALSGFATTAMERAASEGVATSCDRGSWHILEQKLVLDTEAERIGCRPAHFDSYTVERELREYAIADRIVVPSEPARQSFLRQGVSPTKLVKVPYGVDISDFNPSCSSRRSGAVVSVGTVGMQKGHRYLVDAFRSLETSHASLTLVGPIESGWQERLALTQGDIRTTGALPRAGVIEELQRAAVFALASIHDGLALVIAQAMACGLPVVATDATGIGELVDDGVEGLIVPARDSVALARALDTLLGDPERATEMGRAARDKVAALGGWNDYGDRIMKVFEGIAGGTR
jgi:glycosyltransferase involved in cell wall biosynthesis